MKTKVALFLSFIALLLCDGGQKAQAQIEDIYFPYSNYMNWYVDHPLSDNLLMVTNGYKVSTDTIWLHFHPYNFASPSRVDSCKIYGLAACFGVYGDGLFYGVSFSQAEMAIWPYNNGFPVDAELEAMIYEGTEGDTVLRLVKRQAFTISKGQYPDKGMHFSDTGGVRTGVYEFYFDSPVTVKGTFFVGFRDLNPSSPGDIIGCTPVVSIVDASGRHTFCVPGYTILKVYHGRVQNWTPGCTHWTDYTNFIPDVEELGLTAAGHPSIFPIIRLGNGAVDEAEREADGVEVLPNPTRGHAAVQSERAIRSLEVCDMSGRVVQKKHYAGEQYKAELPEGLPQGCYVVKVETVQGTAVKKLVVE